MLQARANFWLHTYEQTQIFHWTHVLEPCKGFRCIALLWTWRSARFVWQHLPSSMPSHQGLRMM